MLQAMKIPDAKSAADKEREKLEKLPAWQLSNVKSKKGVLLEAQREKKESPFCYIDGLLSLQNAELEQKYQKYKGRVVLRGDVVNDDSGSFAVFTEQGSSASQMIAAKVMDVIARLPDCAGHAADEVSAYTQEKWRTLQGCLNSRSQNVQINGYVFQDTNGRNFGQASKTQWFLTNETCTDTHLLASCGKDNFEEVLSSLERKKYRTVNVY